MALVYAWMPVSQAMQNLKALEVGMNSKSGAAAQWWYSEDLNYLH